MTISTATITAPTNTVIQVSYAPENQMCRFLTTMVYTQAVLPIRRLVKVGDHTCGSTKDSHIGCQSVFAIKDHCIIYIY